MSIFKASSPKIPPPVAPPPIPPLPKPVNPGISQQRKTRDRVRAAAGGRPIFTSPGGLLKPATTTGLKTLLGA